ncbi:Gfo/Idh/MocA family oxidoreductase [bacterium]|nr:Gfo/Idh/MocA family oxidoreductase [bacterium]
MALEKTRIGIIGCGGIMYAYATAKDRLDILDIVACADLLPERARAKAEEFGIPKACSVDELLADPDIEIVVNLTIPRVHAEISLAALQAGKHAYSEKPLGVTREQGRAILALAQEQGLRVGCAPDTFLGAGGQTCRKLLDDGWIGEPIGASAFMMCHGPERWHADPDFFYHPGAGPLFDMGPYYLTALTNLLGPTASVAASATISFPERVIGSQPHYGEVIRVDTPTHVNGLLQFAGGAVGTISTSFDVWASTHVPIEIYGTEGTMVVPDPNSFGGPVRLRRCEHTEWTEVPLTHGYAEQNRGLGLADMAYAIRSGRPHRASGELAYHVLDIMHTLYEASDQRQYVEVCSSVGRPEPFPVGLQPRTLDA